MRARECRGVWECLLTRALARVGGWGGWRGWGGGGGYICVRAVVHTQPDWGKKEGLLPLSGTSAPLVPAEVSGEENGAARLP